MTARLRRLAMAAVRIYLLLVVLLAAFQRRLLYYPTRMTEAEAVSLGETVGLVPWRSETASLIGWKSRSAGDAPHKLLVIHGNAGAAVHRVDYVDAFERLDEHRQWQVRLLEYPGYGSRTGSPGRTAFANAAAEALREWRTGGGEPVFILGESIGSGVACDLAASEGDAVGGLVLVTPFARLLDVARKHFPIFPVGLLLRDRWDTVAALSNFARPTAIIVAGRDDVVGAEQSERLYGSVKGPKRCWRFPEATHNAPEIQDGHWAAEVSAFLLGRTLTNP